MQKIIRHSATTGKLGSALILGLLMFVLPCHVRNVLKHSFGLITETQQHEKASIQVNTNCCIVINQYEVVKTKPEKDNSASKFVVIPATAVAPAILIPTTFSKPFVHGEKIQQNVPLYILYKRLKFMI